MIKSVIDCALDAFIRGLLENILIFIDTRNPKDLSKAFEHALHAEERQKYTEKTRNTASAYHITRSRDYILERLSSPSLYTIKGREADLVDHMILSSLRGNIFFSSLNTCIIYLVFELGFPFISRYFQKNCSIMHGFRDARVVLPLSNSY